MAMIGALAPDIDAEDSSIKRGLGVAGHVASFSLRLFGIRHRGLTHYGLIALLVTTLGWLFTVKSGYGDIGLAFGLGYLSHVALGGCADAPWCPASLAAARPVPSPATTFPDSHGRTDRNPYFHRRGFPVHYAAAQSGSTRISRVY